MLVLNLGFEVTHAVVTFLAKVSKIPMDLQHYAIAASQKQLHRGMLFILWTLSLLSASSRSIKAQSANLRQAQTAAAPSGFCDIVHQLHKVRLRNTTYALGLALTCSPFKGGPAVSYEGSAAPRAQLGLLV